MKVCGFTIIRNAIKYDYPVVESFNSILPICDEFVVAVGESEDDTLKLIESIGSSKIKIIHTKWDDSLREGGKVLAVETDKAFDYIKNDFDWCFYIQSDEVVHEKDHEVILNSMIKYKDADEVNGLLFNYIHFYGSYDFIGASKRWYRKEIRIIKNDKSIRSFRDAQGFRKNGHKLFVKQIEASIYHYGWVKHPIHQMEKQLNFNKLWHSDEWVKKQIGNAKEYDYSRADIIKRFNDSHPKVMHDRINNMNWELNFDPTKLKVSTKLRINHLIETLFGFRIGEYKNYKVI